jgi:hypothetical protein
MEISPPPPQTKITTVSPPLLSDLAEAEHLVASLFTLSTLLQLMITTCSRLVKNWEQAVQTYN